MKLSDFKVFTFDCYGTLVDWETGILTALRPWARRHGLEASDGDLLAAFGRSEASQQQRPGPFRLYPEILRAVFADIAAEFRRPVSPEEATAFARSVGDWPPFPDTCDALRQLQQWHKLVVVSNVDRASFARTQERLGVRFDAVVTAEDAGVYKPDHGVFLRAFDKIGQWGVSRGEILHVAQSLYHDHVPAKTLGLKTAWVDRRQRTDGGGATPAAEEAVDPDWVVPTLATLADMERTERAAV